MSNGAELPDDVETLRALLLEARAQLAERDLEIEQLKAQLDKLRRMQFGRKSEQLDREVARLETALEDLTKLVVLNTNDPNWSPIPSRRTAGVYRIAQTARIELLTR